MEFKELFAGMAFLVLALAAIFTFAADFNTSYATSWDGGLTTTYEELNSTTYGALQEVAEKQNEIIIPASGSDQGDTNEDSLLGRANKILSSTKGFLNLLGLIPTAIREGAGVLGVPAYLQNIAVWVFIFSFVITLITLILLGVTKFR